jgi:putative PIN family toxin of toxin-antitoxin system
MTGRGRFVADTNVLVSFILRPGSTPGRAVRAGLLERLMVFSDDTLTELRDVLKRPKFDPYVAGRQRKRAFQALADAALHVEVVERIRACSDPRDDRILEAAVAGHADLILTGDKALLALHPFRNIEIVTAAEYLADEQRS